MGESKVRTVDMDSNEAVPSVSGEVTRRCGKMEETSPEMLKNTPSNIRRLTDEIEQFEGRQKFLAKTRSPSDGGDVRWYFCKVPLDENVVAASVPRAEIVGKGDYFRFGMRDSLAIEASFLQREEELLSVWWKEYAECSEGPKARPSSSTELDQNPRASLESAQSAQFYALEEERVGVPVKGGLYEVDLAKRHCFPVYWSGENRRVLRGHWFSRKSNLDWLPLREDVAEQLEYAYRSQVWHRRTFQPSGLFAARVDLQGSTPGLHTLFTGEDDTWEAWLNVDTSGLSSVIGFGGNGLKLRRGYAPSQSAKPTQDELRQQKEEEMDDYCSQVPVQHLVFMVHGIGQRLEKSNLVDDVANFRHITASLAEQHLSLYQRGTQRVLFIPCQWRRGLKLSGESAVEKITLDGVRGLRVMLSATVHDVLYYMSPIYCQNVIDSVSNQLNFLYLKFLKRNPGYDGKVSIYGHSLGSVLSYDILCHQENLTSPFPMNWIYRNTEREKISPDVDCKPSKYSPTSNSDENRSENESVTNHNVKDYAKSPHNLENPSPSLDADNSFMVGIRSKNQYNAPLSNEDTPELVFDQSGMISLQEGIDEPPSENKDSVSTSGNGCLIATTNENGYTVATTSKNVDLDATTREIESPVAASSGKGSLTPEEIEVEKFEGDDCLVANSVQIKEEKSECDKDKAIKLLKEEIYSLNAKITELELQCSNKVNNKESGSLKSQLIPELLPFIQNDSQKTYTPHIKYTKLEFKVDTFFAVGSPLGVFLALRNVRVGIGKGQGYWEGENINEEMPACQRMFNIFHPFDPVAYRIEPLICKEYIDKRPVIIPYHRGGKRLHIGFQEFSEDLASRSQAIRGHISSITVKVLTLCQSRNKDELDALENTLEKEEKPYGSIMLERLTGCEDGRIDHVLQDQTFRHPYISAIGAHTNYWRDYDTALFILTHLYRDIPEEPTSPDERGDSKTGYGVGTWCEQREAADDELLLTFADKGSIRSFSRRARKLTKR